MENYGQLKAREQGIYPDPNPVTMTPARIRGDAGNTYNPPAEPIGHIPQQVQEQERLTSALLEELAALEHRLSFVLRPSAPDGTQSQGAGTQPVTSALAQGLGELNARLYVAMARVRSMTARVDL
jgi:hypothetical protein